MPRELKQKAKQVARRGNNEGSIYQRKDGRWCATVTTGYKKDGSIIRKYLYGSTRQEVARLLAGVTTDVYENGYSTISPGDRIYFTSVLDEWFATFKAPTISSQTEAKLRNMMKNHIFKSFGELELEQVDLVRLQRFFNQCMSTVCIQSVRHMKQLLNQFFNYAVKQKYVKFNPVADIKIKSSKLDDSEEQKPALTPEQRMVIFNALKDEDILKPILITFAFTGLRPGELIALQWRNIDFKKSIITIQKAIQHEIKFDEFGNVVEKSEVLGRTNTSGSVRTFKMHDNVINALLEWNLRQKEQEQKTGLNMTAGDKFVFCTKEGKMRTYSGLRSLLVRFLKRNGSCASRNDIITIQPCNF